jgi:hypothetical protein
MMEGKRAGRVRSDVTVCYYRRQSIWRSMTDQKGHLEFVNRWIVGLVFNGFIVPIDYIKRVIWSRRT